MNPNEENQLQTTSYVNDFINSYLRSLKLFSTIVILFVLNSVNAQQKVGFGISLEGGIAILANAQKTAKQLYKAPLAPNYPELTNNWGVSNNSEFSVDMLLPKRGLQFSTGIRLFDWRYTRDSVAGLIHSADPITYLPITYTYYYAVKRTLTNGVPFLSCSYRHGDPSKFSFIHTVSIGYFGVIERVFEKKANYGGEDYEYAVNKPYDRWSFKFQKDNSVMDLKLFSGIEKIFYDALVLKFGLSYYYARNSVADQHCWYANAAVSIRINE